MAALLLALRRFRDGRPAVLGLVVLVLVTAAAAALTPRLLDRFADDALRGEVAQATPFQRNIQLVQERRYEAARTGDPLGAVVKEGESLEKQMPGRIRDLFFDHAYVVDTFRWSILNDTPDPSFIRLRIQQHAMDRVQFVDGRAPTATVRKIVEERPDPEQDLEITVLEVALSTQSLREIGLKVGDTISMRPDETDRLVGRGGGVENGAVDIVGAFEVIDETAPYWIDDTALARPAIRTLGGDSKLIDVTAMLAPEAYTVLLSGTGLNHNPFRYTWQYFVDRDRLESERLTSLLVELRRLESTFPSTGGNAVESGTALRSGLLPLLEGEHARWTSAIAVLTVVGLGPAAVGIAALALIGIFVMQRRRTALALGRARGASSGQLIVAVAIEGLVISLPPAVIAVGLAMLLVPTGPATATVVAAAIVAIVTTLLLVAAGAPTALAPPRGPARDAPAARRPTPRRLAMEGLIVALSVVGAFLLRERGLSGASSAAALGGADPFVAVVPALAGIAAGIVAVRLLPVPMLVFARLAAIRRDLVPVLALRRVTRGGTGGAVLIVLMATATIGTFAGATLVHLDRAAEAVAWQEVGAPYRITSPGSLPATFDPMSLPGAQVTAGQYQVSSLVADRFLPLQLVAIDAADYAAVVRDTGRDANLPRSMIEPTADPIPAIVSPELTTGADGVGVGGEFDVVVEGYRVTFRVVEIREAFSAVGAGQAFVIASRDQLRALRGGAGLRTTNVVYLRAPDSAATNIRAALSRVVAGARLDSRAERTASIRTSPIIQSLIAGVATAAIIAFVYAALAVSAALALSGAARAVEVAHLRTLGLTRREALGLVVVEHGPTIVVAFGAGVALGLGLFAMLRESLGLAALVGATVDVAVGIEPIQLLAVLLAIVIIVGLGIGLGAAFQRSAAPAAAVRRGFD